VRRAAASAFRQEVAETNDYVVVVSEADIIRATGSRPVTQRTLVSDLRRLGVPPAEVVIVHSSLSAIGWVGGGPHGVVLALEEVLGDDGTLVMPAHSGALSEPSQWQNPPVPESWWPIIRAETPAFDPDLTPTRQMGAIVDCFRTQPGTMRSSHPQFSFAARGPRAADITNDHSLEYGLGERSPLARVYDLNGYVLLLGVGHANNTSIHLGEYRLDGAGQKTTTNGAPVTVEGERRWVEFEDIELDESDFDRLGNDFESETTALKSGESVSQKRASCRRGRSSTTRSVG
jgi:aminoglycoside 3-N-acetyltransferase